MIEMKFESKLKAKIVCILKTFESWMNAEYSGGGNHSLSISISVSVAVHCCAPTLLLTIRLQLWLETQLTLSHAIKLLKSMDFVTKAQNCNKEMLK
jgi:hypothetical protein